MKPLSTCAFAALVGPQRHTSLGFFLSLLGFGFPLPQPLPEPVPSMATVAPAADQATDLLQKLTIDPKIQTLEVPEPTKKKYGSDAGEVANVLVSSCEWSTPPPLQDFMDPNMCYLNNGYTSYYHGGYDVPINEWEDYPRYVTPDGVEMPPLGVFGDNGSLMYHHGYGYPPYGPYSPAGSPVMGHDGQLYGPQHYQYAPYYYPPATLNGSHPPAPNTKGDNSISTAADQVPLPVEATNGIANGSVNGSNEPVPLKSSSQNAFLTSNGSYGRGVLPGSFPACGYQDPRFGFDGVRSPTPWLDGPVSSEGQPKPTTSCSVSSNINPSMRNQNLHRLPHLMALHPPKGTPGVGPAPVYMNRMYPNSRLYGQYGNMIRTDNGFGVSGFNSRVNGRGWLTVDNKYKSRGRGNGFFGRGNENMDGLNELNRGPRAGCFNDQKGFVPNITLAVKGQNLDTNCTKGDSNMIPDRNQYNRAEFPVKYSDVKFFIIKSYSEDDIHKSIKYSVWASTANGNKKLDAGYCEAQGQSSGCPVFLFFSVNTSGQFVGVAEMVGPVDFNKNVEYWQQDKWNGCFPVKWHIIKDLPNGLLKHITLENNDYKPVTNSRDTQEVKLEQGLEMLKIFKDHTSKTCILDDFGFYEAREKTMLERKAKQQQFHKQAREKTMLERKAKQQQFHKQVCDGKPAGLSSDEKDKERSNIKARSYKPLEFSSILNNEAGQDIGEWKQSDRSLVAVVGNSPNGAAKPASEKRLVANGSVANGC